MTHVLKADTAVKVVIGPVVAVGDGFTPVTTLAVSTADEAEILKHDATAVTSISGNTFAAITSADGYYNLTLTAGQLDTEGMLTVLINDDSLCLPVKATFMVVNANVYDSLYAAATTDYLQTDTIQLGGVTQSLTDLKDFADAGYDPATNKVQGVVLVDSVTSKSGYALSATGLDAIASTATGMVEIAKAIWDRVLTGATHNIATSAGRRLRGIQEFQGYEEGAIWIDTINGTAGTVDYENGTVENPVDTLADAITLNTSLGFNRFRIFNGSSLTLAQTFNNYLFKGEHWTLALGGQDIGGSFFIGATVSGISTGTEARFDDCSVNTCTIDLMHLHRCGIQGTITVGAAGDQFLDECHSAIAGSGAPVFDVGATVANSNINVRHYSGGLDFRNIGQLGTDNVSIEGDGQVILNANCVSGTISIRGNFELTDNSATTTVNDDARYDAPRHVGLTWNEILSKANYNIGQSAAKLLRQGGDLVQIDGTVSDVSPSVSNFDTDLTQADTFFNDAVLIFSNGSANAGIGKPVSAYLNANGNMTFNAPDPWPVTPVNGDDFVIFAVHVHPVAQIAGAVWDEAMVEATAAPAVTGTFRAAMQWVFALSRNKITQTSTTQTLRNDADSADIATSTDSDDTTTLTRGEWQ